MSEYCQGCYSSYEYGCSHSKYNTDSECPCTECAIKMMCNDPCPEFECFNNKVTVLEERETHE